MTKDQKLDQEEILQFIFQDKQRVLNADGPCDLAIRPVNPLNLSTLTPIVDAPHGCAVGGGDAE